MEENEQLEVIDKDSIIDNFVIGNEEYVVLDYQLFGLEPQLVFAKVIVENEIRVLEYIHHEKLSAIEEEYLRQRNIFDVGDK